jgi:hypothetical protein
MRTRIKVLNPLHNSIHFKLFYFLHQNRAGLKIIQEGKLPSFGRTRSWPTLAWCLGPWLLVPQALVPRRDLVQPADVPGGAGTVRLLEGSTSLHRRREGDFQWQRGGSSGGGGETLVCFSCSPLLYLMAGGG